MADQAALKRAFADFARTISDRYEIGDVLYRLTDQIVDVLEVDGAGVSLGHEADSLRFVTATDDRVSRLEDAQVAARSGPCFDAYRSGDLTVCEDLEAEDRWPSYREAAVGEGFRSVAGIPMPIGERRIGALDLYRSRPGSWDVETLDVAQLLANTASGYILNWQALQESRTLAEQLQRALDSRVVIEQAKGMVAARHEVDPGAAFDILRRRSRSTSTRLHEICRQVVAGELDI